MVETTPFDVAVLNLHFTLEAVQVIHLGPQAGAQLRGALWAALRQSACTSPDASPRELAAHSQHCPMCRLMHLETWMGERGINPARPFAIRPPLTVHPGADRIFTQGESFNITLNLFGDAVEAVSYVVQAMMRVGEIGVGYHRGRFRVVNVEAIHPFTGQTQALMPRPGKLKKPELILTAQDVHTYIHNARTQPMRLRFLTPTQLTAEGKPLDKPTFPVLIARLLERCQSLEQTYTPQPPPASQWRERHLRLTNAAAHIKVTSSTTWVRIESGSRRISERNAMGGFVGDMILDGDLMPFLVWIAWGSLLHVGKNAVKGGGWYEIL